MQKLNIVIMEEGDATELTRTRTIREALVVLRRYVQEHGFVFLKNTTHAAAWCDGHFHWYCLDATRTRPHDGPKWKHEDEGEND